VTRRARAIRKTARQILAIARPLAVAKLRQIARERQRLERFLRSDRGRETWK
jgi:hypothetical protein